ncbi:MAG: mercury(II) reductase [Bacteroidia bacterium]|nr:MAG: mercury(II) reductase [Bacteroidia bacterium]
MNNYPLIIIGGGAAAFAAATKANDLGAEALIVNSGLPIGGTCVNVGCVPSKHLLEVGARYYYGQRPGFSAIQTNGQFRFDFAQAIAYKNQLVDALRQSNYSDVIANFKTVEYREGTARFVSPHEIEIEGHRVRGETFIIATGSKAKILPFPGIEKVRYLTNIEALELNTLPSSMIVVGGGPLGLEFAQMYAHFGTKVTVLEKMKRILPLEEPEVSDELQTVLEEEGVTIHTGVDIRQVREDGGKKIVVALVKNTEKEFRADHLLLATGIEPNTNGLALENAGVNVDQRGFVVADETLQTTQRHIWAAGDCVGKLALETVAAKEGAIAADNALNTSGARKKINYDEIPHAVFTMPQVASVGLTERELMKRINVCSCRTVPLSAVPKAKAVGETRGVIKLVVDPHTGIIVGCHIVAPAAAEMIHEAVLAVKFKLTIDDIIDTVHTFPTFSEGIKFAAQAFTRDISVMTCCIG